MAPAAATGVFIFAESGTSLLRFSSARLAVPRRGSGYSTRATLSKLCRAKTRPIPQRHGCDSTSRNKLGGNLGRVNTRGLAYGDIGESRGARG